MSADVVFVTKQGSWNSLSEINAKCFDKSSINITNSKLFYLKTCHAVK